MRSPPVKTCRTLPLAAIALLAALPGSLRADTPPYAIQAMPPATASEGSAVRFKPIRSPNTLAPGSVCILEVWPEGPAHGAVWTGERDPGCSRESAVNLPAGRYVVKLSVTWQAPARGPLLSGTATLPYAVISTVNKLQMWSCGFTPARPMAGRSASLTWEVRSGATTFLGAFHVSILADHQPLDSFMVDALAPGARFSRTVPWTPASAGTFRLECAADPENALHEDPAQRKDNFLFDQVTVLAAELLKPLVVLRTLTLSPLGWSQDYAVCNVDPDAFYKVELTGCARPCIGGYDGVPARDFGASAVSDGGGSCPADLVSRIAFTPGPAEGPRNHFEDRTYTLKVTATKGGASVDSGPVAVRVPQYCGVFSFPVCVENESPGR
jgi:hypothetical protein